MLSEKVSFREFMDKQPSFYLEHAFLISCTTVHVRILAVLCIDVLLGSEGQEQVTQLPLVDRL